MASNSTPKEAIPCTISFRIQYDQPNGTLNIHTPKVNNLTKENVKKNLKVTFVGKRLSEETSSKTAWSNDVIWNEHFNPKVNYKNIEDKTLRINVLDAKSSVICAATLDVKDIAVDEETVCTLPVTLNEYRNKGEIVFRIVPSNDYVDVWIVKAMNLSRTMREYTVLGKLLSSQDSEKRTCAKESPAWDEGLRLEGENVRADVLILGVIGEKPNERAVLGEVRLNIADVKNREYRRILALREPQVESVRFSTLIENADGSDRMVMTGFTLENFRASTKRRKVYVQVKKGIGEELAKKKRTTMVTLMENPSFESQLSFSIDRENMNTTSFHFTVKTQKYRYVARKKTVLGRIVIGPFSKTKWYGEFINRRAGEEKHHSLPLEMIQIEALE